MGKRLLKLEMARIILRPEPRKGTAMNLRFLGQFGGAMAGALMTVTLGASGAHASTVLTEDFNEVPFGLWQSGWFGTESNAENYYVAYEGEPIDYRGNNPDGLWVAAGSSGSGTPVTIDFSSAFAASLTAFSFDVASYIDSTLTIFDKNGVTLLSTAIPMEGDAFSDPGVYAFYSATSSSGIGGFSFSGPAQGNISIDNLSATVSSTIPEPSTWAMMLVGFTGLGYAGYRSRSRTAALAV